MEKVAFILNPISGTFDKSAVVSYIEWCLKNYPGYEGVVYRTKSKRDANRAAGQFVEEGYTTVVAVGGDGTVNEVASALVGSGCKLGIVPAGSGNGLARHLNIPMSFSKAIETVFDGKTKLIDAGKVNDEYFFCTAGVGFDAHVGNKFNKASTRGLATYVEFCAREYMKYRPQEYEISILDAKFRQKAFLITFANSSQWGNNAFIAPDADISDGMIDVVVWKNTPKVTMPLLTAELFLKTIKYSEFIDIYRCRELEICREEEGYVQIDGESRMMGRSIKVSSVFNALEVVVPKESRPIPQIIEKVPQQLKNIVPRLKDMVNK